MTTPATLKVRNTEVKFVKSFGVTTEAIRRIGVVEQCEYVGARGASFFVQFFANGTARAIRGMQTFQIVNI